MRQNFLGRVPFSIRALFNVLVFLHTLLSLSFFERKLKLIALVSLTVLMFNISLSDVVINISANFKLALLLYENAPRCNCFVISLPYPGHSKYITRTLKQWQKLFNLEYMKIAQI